ncbi:MAG TPA: carboxylating nicotinate-nucleotide diphosphorylase [Thermodesulfobacteriota bacterium]|nr:carboxylating nicotinate-nucleotide diphosphorylase [Thermodesulfobacteriota bacterium]
MIKTRLERSQIEPIIENALREDIGSGDITTNLLFPEDSECRAIIIAKEEGIVAGLPIAEMVFKRLDEGILWNEKRRDGDSVKPGDTLAEIQGRTRAILTGERVALNLLQRLSGIATLTSRFVKAVEGLPVKIMDTRKTAPGLRILDKYGVSVGGGYNHRFGLYDGVLIKDNHIRLAGGISRAVRLIREGIKTGLKIEVETSTLEEVREALEAGADIIMLDNMPVSIMKRAVEMIGGNALTEASGGINLENVREVAETGVDFISIGALTHSPRALDIGLYMVS